MKNLAHQTYQMRRCCRVTPILLAALACVVGPLSDFSNAAPANAQSAEAPSTPAPPVAAPPVARPTVKLVHTALRAEQLPFPGEKIPLKVIMQGSRDYEFRLRTFAVIDGVLSDIAPTKAYLNEQDLATYEVELFAPVAELSYQFVLYGRDGATVATSPRYLARRPCVPEVKAVSNQRSDDKPLPERLSELEQDANSLSSELGSYETALRVVQELREKLPKK